MMAEMLKVTKMENFIITYLYKIDIPELPMVKVDQERVDNGAQCTTCLETFNLGEDVAKLKCQVSHTIKHLNWELSNNCSISTFSTGLVSSLGCSSIKLVPSVGPKSNGAVEL
jgi:hypothetical protein